MTRAASLTAVAGFANNASALSRSNSVANYPDYSELDKALRRPVLKREFFSSPVMIERVELLQDRNNFICRVRSSDGAVGLSIGPMLICRSSLTCLPIICHE